MDGYDYRDEHPLYRGDSVEVFFLADAQLGTKVEAMFGVMDRSKEQGKPLAAYVSLRFMAGSRALLATHRPGLEHDHLLDGDSMLRGMRGNNDALIELQRTAVEQGGRVHRGQQNDLTADQVRGTIPGLSRWLAQLQALEGQSTTFLTPFAEPTWTGCRPQH